VKSTERNKQGLKENTEKHRDLDPSRRRDGEKEKNIERERERERGREERGRERGRDR
jgi:hypothetical protein